MFRNEIDTQLLNRGESFFPLGRGLVVGQRRPRARRLLVLSKKLARKLARSEQKPAKPARSEEHLLKKRGILN